MKIYAIGFLLILLIGCTPSMKTPDLGGIYSAAAKNKGPERNPIIVIPGMLGSRLVNADGRVVWGEFGGRAIDLGGVEGMRALALPLSGKGWPKDGLRPDGALEQVKVSLGFDFQFSAYSGMLRAFGAGGYLDSDHSALSEIDYGPGHYTCFQFGYDWRRSCAENAVLLGRFIDEKKRYVSNERFKRTGKRSEVKFDIVAHSMGGLVARYYAMYGKRPLASGGKMAVTWAGAKDLDKLVMVGTPNDGSIYPVQQLSEGYKLAPFFPRIPPAVIGTMPSMYELMPRTEAGAVIDKDSNPIAIFQTESWKSLNWGLADPAQEQILAQLLPEIADSQERRKIAIAHLSKMLSNARDFHRAMNAKAVPPAGFQIHAFAGDAVSTGSRAQVGADGVPAIIDYLAGDGVVTRKSMLMDRRGKGSEGGRLQSPIHWTHSQFVFSDHKKMTSDPAFVDNVLHLLLERP